MSRGIAHISNGEDRAETDLLLNLQAGAVNLRLLRILLKRAAKIWRPNIPRRAQEVIDAPVVLRRHKLDGRIVGHITLLAHLRRRIDEYTEMRANGGPAISERIIRKANPWTSLQSHSVHKAFRVAVMVLR